jgi:hypothetical protein
MRFFPCFIAAALAALSLSVSLAQDVTSRNNDMLIRQLEEFGPIGNPAEVQKTWAAAREAFKDKAGVIVVPASAWPMLKSGSLQSLIRIPDPPAETKSWRQGSGLTVLTADRERPVVHVPPLSGVKLERELRMNDGDSVPHWGTHPMLTLESRLVYGSVSYLDWLQAATEKGTDRRFYVPTVRGLVPGQFLNVHGGPGYGGGVTRAVIKSLGYDKEKELHYFVADTSLDHIPGGIAQNKSNTGLIHMTQTSHADNQTYDVKVIRNQYAHGDTYIYYCDFNYMTNCPWTSDVVGRFFAVDEKSEKTPKGNFRWYQITKFKANDDGTKEIEIERFWWGAKSAGSPTLYNAENHTWDDHVRPLNYIIAPGTYVNDVSRAVTGGDRGGQRTLGLAPHSAQATTLDFAQGDRVEQAIGPDPFKPNVFRAWMWEDVPSQFPASVFEIANHGAASRYAVLWARGGPASLDDVAKRHEPKPAWDNIIVVDSAATVGLNLKADFATAAILFQQPRREQPIKWHYGHPADQEEDSPKTGITRAVSSRATTPQVASLTVSRTTGEFQFEGGGLQAGGPVSNVTGLSADTTPARNLRGKNVEVPAGKTTLEIRFPHSEADNNYAVFIEQSWLTNRAISNKTATGFTVTFAEDAPEHATLDWMLVR